MKPRRVLKQSRRKVIYLGDLLGQQTFRFQNMERVLVPAKTIRVTSMGVKKGHDDQHVELWFEGVVVEDKAREREQ